MSTLNKAAAIFSSTVHLEKALKALSEGGFENVSVLIKQEENDGPEVRTYSTATYPATQSSAGVERQLESDAVSEKDPEALNNASATGGLLGAAAGLVAMIIPGVGPVLATGTLASAIGVMAAGGAMGMTAGAIGGLLKDEGLPSDRVELYRDAFNMGKGVVIVNASEDLDILRARDLLNRFQPDHIDTF